MVAGMVALCLLVPALMINIDWAAGILAPWNLAAVGAIVGSAIFVEASAKAASWMMRPVYLVCAVLLFACNVQVAFENAATRSDHRSDHRKSSMVAAKTQSSQRSQWSQGRTEAATVAGETPAASFVSQIEAAKFDRLWTRSKECTDATATESREFCKGVESLKSKLAAAQRRDDLDRKIEAVDAKTETGEVVTSADPFADNVAAVLGIFGIEVSEASKKAVGAQKDLLRSLALEVVATFGPSAWLAAFSALLAFGHNMRTEAPRSENMRTKAKKGDTSKPKPETVAADVPEPPVALDDPFHKFVSEIIEEVPGVSTPAGEPWQAYLSWCAKAGKDAGSQKAFGGKMKARFAWESNNNRPRYLNLRVRKAAPHLRVVG